MNSISRDPAAAAPDQPGNHEAADRSIQTTHDDVQGRQIRSQKQALRTHLLPIRRTALARSAEVSEAIARGVRAWLDAHDFGCVGFYWPLDGEPDLRAMIISWLAHDQRRRAALPLVARAATPLRFVAWAADTPMRVGKYGIAVPDIPAVSQHDIAGTVDPEAADASASAADAARASAFGTHEVVPDALLIPCVGFDRRGFRLGYGGGFYDRTLAAYADGRRSAAAQDGAEPPPSTTRETPATSLNAASHRPATLGIALDDTRIDALPSDAFDLPLDAIQTERQRYRREPG